MKIVIESVLGMAFLFTAVSAHAQQASQSIASSARSPIIVNNISFTDQSGAIPQTAIFTPPKDGLFRVSVYFETVATNSANQGLGSYFCSDLVTTNDSGASQDNLGAGCLQVVGSLSNSSAWGSYFLRAKAGTPMLFAVNLVAGSAPVSPYAYNVYLIIERL